MQIARLSGTPTAATILKLLPYDTPALPSGVKGIIRFDRLPNAATILKLVGDPYAYTILTDDGSFFVTDEGDYRAYVD